MKTLLVFFLALPLVASSQTWMLSGPDVSAGSGSSIEYWIKNDSTNAVGYCNTPLTGGSFVYHFNNGNPDVDYTGNFSAQGFGGSIPAGGSVRIAVMEVASAGYWATANGTVSVQAGSSIGSYVATSPASLPTSATAGIITYHISDITVPCITNLVYHIRNNSLAVQKYVGVSAHSSYLGELNLDAGKIGTLSFTVPCDDVSSVQVLMMFGDDEGKPLQPDPSLTNASPFQILTNSIPVTTSPNDGTNVTVITPPSPVQFNPQDTNNPPPILFSAPAQTNVAQAMQEGSSALYDAVTKASQQAHEDANKISNQLATNGTGGTGSSVALTNYNLETTQVQILNALTNSETRTNDAASEQIAASSSASIGSNYLSGLAGGTSPLASDNPVGSDNASWTISIPYGGGYLIDLNPFNQSWVVSIAAFVRSFVKWSLLAGLIVGNSSALLSALQSLGATRQASASGQSILGINANLVTALAMAAAITVVMVSLPLFAFTYFTDYIVAIHNSPFASTSSATVSTSVWMADQFFPLSVMVSVVVGHYTFRFALGAIVWSVQTITRFLVG